jgi:hypothetical protein
MIKSSAEWRAEIAGSWREQLVSIMRTGQLLRDAKASLKHGEWKGLFSDSFPFKIGTAQRLMRIASDARLTNPAHGPHLPPCWRTLYVLTRLSDQQFELGLQMGTIHSDMERSDAEFLSGLAVTGEHDGALSKSSTGAMSGEGEDVVSQCSSQTILRDGPHAASGSSLVQKREAYLEECRKLPDKKREAELHIVTAALSATNSDILLKRRAAQLSVEQRKVKQAKEIIALRAETTHA